MLYDLVFSLADIRLSSVRTHVFCFGAENAATVCQSAGSAAKAVQSGNLSRQEKGDCMSKLLCIKGMNEGDEFPLKEGKNLVGRRKHCDAVLFDRSCSREQCWIHKTRNYHLVEDLDSSNGTFVNGHRLTKRTEMEEDDLLEVGTTVLQLSLKPVGNLADRVARDVTEELTGEEYTKLFKAVASQAVRSHYEHTQRYSRGQKPNGLRSLIHRHES